MPNKTAAAVIIGNEVLSGKVKCENSFFLAEQLYSLGVELKRITTIPDEMDDISQVIREYKDKYDFVFTTGGVGPTHDDITAEAVAMSFNRQVVYNMEVGGMLQAHYGERLNPARLKMANLPEGTALIKTRYKNAVLPVFVVENVYMFPGIPDLLKTMFTEIKEHFRNTPFYNIFLYFKVSEGKLAALLTDTSNKYTNLLLGSYPLIFGKDYKVKVILESKEKSLVVEAFNYILERVDEDWIFEIKKCKELT